MNNISDPTISIKSPFEILAACNAAMMESAVLGNTVARQSEQALKAYNPLYEDMSKQAEVMKNMSNVLFYFQLTSILMLPLGLAVGGLGASLTGSAELLQGAATITQNVVQGAHSGATGISQLKTSQAQAALDLDQGEISSITGQTKTLSDMLKGSFSNATTIGQATAGYISSSAQADVAYKEHKR